MLVQMNVCTHEWVNECTNECKNDCINEWPFNQSYMDARLFE